MCFIPTEQQNKVCVFVCVWVYTMPIYDDDNFMSLLYSTSMSTGEETAANHWTRPDSHTFPTLDGKCRDEGRTWRTLIFPTSPDIMKVNVSEFVTGVNTPASKSLDMLDNIFDRHTSVDNTPKIMMGWLCADTKNGTEWTGIAEFNVWILSARSVWRWIDRKCCHLFEGRFLVYITLFMKLNIVMLIKKSRKAFE